MYGNGPRSRSVIHGSVAGVARGFYLENKERENIQDSARPGNRTSDDTLPMDMIAAIVIVSTKGDEGASHE